jgi:aminotransferase
VNEGASRACSHLASRIGSSAPGIREELLALADSLPDVIRLGRGDPDLDTAPNITEAGIRALRDGCTHYTHWAGIPELREEISKKLLSDNGLTYDAGSEIVVTAGVQQALFVALHAIINPGDEVLIGDPFYNYYEHAVALAGGKLTLVPTYDQDFVLTAAALDSKLSRRTKAVIIVSPNNPSGAVIPSSELEKIAALAKREDLLILSDEIYEKILFDDVQHTSIASFPGMYTRSIVLNGFSKAYAMTGWRIGYLAAPADFVKRIQVLKHCMALSVHHASQYAALEALRNGESAIKGNVKIFSDRRDVVMRKLDEAGLHYFRPSGSFSVFIDVSKTGVSSEDFCRRLLKEAHVLLFPGCMYGSAVGFVRLSLLAPADVIGAAMERVRGFVNTLCKERRVK